MATEVVFPESSRPDSSENENVQIQLNEREVEALVQLRHNLAEDDSKRKQTDQRNFLIYGGLLAAAAAGSALSIPLEALFGVNSVLWSVIGGLGLALAGGYTIRTLSRNPLEKLENGVNDLYGKLFTKRVRKTGGFERALQTGRKRKRVIAGVGSWLAEKMNVEPGVVRLALVIMLFISSGFMIPLYFIAAIILHNSAAKDEARSLPDGRR